jgi:hypothetical protein
VDRGPDEESGAAADLQLVLSRARWARRYRELLIGEIAAGRLGLAELLAHDQVEPLAGTIKIVVLLQALPSVGKVRARRGLDHLAVAESTRLAALSPAQRQELARWLSAAGEAGPREH